MSPLQPSSPLTKVGPYPVRGYLGAGAFGTVFRALDPMLNREVAIKKLHRRAAEDGSGAETTTLFTREAQATATLSHPNIVTVHGFGVDDSDGAPYMVMEFLGGETLRRVVENRHEMPLADKLEIMSEVAEALQYAHNQGVIHQDIKPENIMVLPDGSVKVMDFAVAPEGAVIGTPDYMAPELFDIQRSDELTDVFAFGVVFYELLTGRLPYDFRDQRCSQRSSLYEPPSVIDGYARCPPWLNELVMSAIRKRRDRRAESIEQVLEPHATPLREVKQTHAAELAKQLRSTFDQHGKEAAMSLVRQIRRFDKANVEARKWWNTLQSAGREANIERAQALVAQANQDRLTGAFSEAARKLEEALTLEPNQDREKDLQLLREKARDQITARELYEEVETSVLTRFQLMTERDWESDFTKLTRAVQLDPFLANAIELRDRIRPHYERACSRRLSETARLTAFSGTMDNPVIARRLLDATAARKRREYEYARQILEQLTAYDSDGRVVRELAAVEQDRIADDAATKAVNTAAAMVHDPEAALAVLNAFAERFPRFSIRVKAHRDLLQRMIDASSDRSSL